MNTRIYEALIRFNPDGPRCLVRTITEYAAGREQENPAIDIALAGPEWDEVREVIGADALAERDQAQAQCDAAIAERDTALSQVEQLTEQLTVKDARIAELEAELDAIRNPPGPDLSTVEGAKRFIAAKRYEVETGGIFVGEQAISTKRDEMHIWLGMFIDITFQPGVRSEFEYKPRDSSQNVVLTPEQVLRCYACIGWFSQACFAVERHLCKRLDDGDPIDAVLSAADAAWPQRHFEWIPN